MKVNLLFPAYGCLFQSLGRMFQALEYLFQALVCLFQGLEQRFLRAWKIFFTGVEQLAP